jgi:hypothetical protein
VIDARLLHQLIQGSGYLRGPSASPQEYKEWFHFCVVGEELEVVANFSLMNNVARVALIVRTGHSWHGNVETIPAEYVQAERGSLALNFGENKLRFSERGFEISIALSEEPVSATLLLIPETVPLHRPNSVLSPMPINWMVVPRLTAHGRVIAGGKRFDIEEAPAYHDHNWGSFAWGEDHAWHWGYALPKRTAARDPQVPSLAFVRLLDRTRARDAGHGLFLWRGAEYHRMFREGEVSISPVGYYRNPSALKVPRPMALLSPETCHDVPEKIGIAARGHGDEVDILFTADHLVQVLVPNDRDLGITVINEISGNYQLRGEVGGEELKLDGRGYFEVLTVSRGPAGQAANKTSIDFGELHSFADFLRASLRALRVEAPEIYAKMCGALQGLVLSIEVDGETSKLAFSKNETFEVGSLEPAVRLSTSSEAILALCDGKTTMVRAVRENSLFLAGSAAELIRFDDGFAIYLAGAMRCASFPELLHNFRVGERKTR